AVAEKLIKSRLLVALEDAGDDAALLSETAAALLVATGPRPFHHDGERWKVPGHVDGHVTERRISVTPGPAQRGLPIMVSGPAASGVAADLGLSYLSCVSDGAEVAHDAWASIGRSIRRATLRLRRPAVRSLPCHADGTFDDVAVVEALVAESEYWGLDVVI